MPATRINKYLSANGYCSRREADRLIKAGKVFINDARAALGDQVGEDDKVRVLGRDKQPRKDDLYLLLHKPVGYAAGSGGERTVLDLVDVPERVHPVDRLDSHIGGLLLLTNDVALTGRLLNPKYTIEQEYVVNLEPALRKVDLGRFQKIGKTRVLSPERLAIVVNEKSLEEIHRLCNALGYRILELTRTRIGTLKMPMSYPEGNWRYLTEKEVRDLKKLVEPNSKR